MGRAPNSVGHQVARVSGFSTQRLLTSPFGRLPQVPGTLVGYMPQEIALYPEFTVRETLYFFSLLLRMPRARYLERMAFLLQLLDISNLKDRLIGA